jgi:hypothetical protein
MNLRGFVGNIIVKIKRRTSVLACQDYRPVFPMGLLKYRFDSFIETVSTQLMCCLEIAHTVIRHISKYTIGYLDQRIVLFLGTPIFKAHTFVFKFLYFRRQKKIQLLFGDDVTVCLDNVALNLCELSRIISELSKV